MLLPGLDPKLPLLNSVSFPLHHFLVLLWFVVSLWHRAGWPCSKYKSQWVFHETSWRIHWINVLVPPPPCLSFFSLPQQPLMSQRQPQRCPLFPNTPNTQMFPFCSAHCHRFLCQQLFQECKNWILVENWWMGGDNNSVHRFLQFQKGSLGEITQRNCANVRISGTETAGWCTFGQEIHPCTPQIKQHRPLLMYETRSANHLYGL